MTINHSPHSSALPPFPHFILASASAGSGKTYQLAWRIVHLLLTGVPFEQVLAVTFTNNAASEMKQRVLLFLKQLALKQADALAEAATRMGALPDDVAERASQLIARILERYDEFQITTIDSFMARLYRASALEFGRDPSFEVLLSKDDAIIEAFDVLASSITEGSEAARQFEALIEMERDSFPWNPYRTVRREVVDLHRTLAALTETPIVDDRAADVERCEQRFAAEWEALRDTCERSGLAVSSHFQRTIDDATRHALRHAMDKPLPAIIIKKPAKNSEAALQQYAATVARIELHREAIAQIVGEALYLRARQRMLPRLIAQQRTDGILDEVKRRRNALFIDDIPRQLIGTIDASAIPDIYLKLGETLRHYLLDEFQDTSPVQWHAILPLLEEAVSQEGSLYIVGDTKQSIYGFRGADWEIMRSLMQPERPDFPFARAIFHPQALDTNYRSDERILDFTTEVFQGFAADDEYAGPTKASGLDDCRQIPKLEHRGMGVVEVSTLLVDATQQPERRRLLEIVDDCLARGYALGDIAVLAPSNDLIVRVSGWLNGHGHAFVSHSSLDARLRKVSGEIIALLRFLDSPIDDHAFATVALGTVFRAFLGDGGPAENELRAFFAESRRDDSHRSLYVQFRERYAELWERSFHPLLTIAGYAPLYDLLSEAMKVFRVFALHPDEEAALARLLEAASLLEQRGDNTLKAFVKESDGGDDDALWSLRSARKPDAVTLMTIHKSKGLDFPVVILLLAPWHRRVGPLLERTGGALVLLSATREEALRSPRLEALYSEQRARAVTDDLNKLYVAFTRPERELYVIGKYGTNRSEKMTAPISFLPAARFAPQAERPRARVARDPGGLPELPLLHTATRIPLRYQPPAKLGFVEQRRGELVHAVLERIAGLDGDLEGAVDAAFAQCARDEEALLDIASIRERVLDFLRSPAAREAFPSPGSAQVRCEQDFVDADGRLFRADRLLVEADRVIVIDFKTGHDSDEAVYIEQVRGYMRLASAVFPGRPVEGRIVYVDRLFVRRVA